MKKKYVYALIISIVLLIGIAAFVYMSFVNSSPQNNDYDAARTAQESNNTSFNDFEDDGDENDNTTDEDDDSNTNKDTENDDSKEETVSATKETEISSFTTKIYTKDSDRQNNITIACSTLNDTIVDNGTTFSFSNTVGKATTGKGYKKADVFKNGDVIEALGGGLCQVSTTLYNAVLKIHELKVTERHPHSNKVPYIKSGKDAAVSYGTYDFKFVNNTGNSLKIKAENTKNNVTIKLLKIE